MNFLSPVWLWSLLALIPLTAVYLLKVRPQRKKTNAYFLWEKVFEERRTSALFQRLRDLFSLLLMIIAFTAVCVALARPRMTSEDDKIQKHFVTPSALWDFELLDLTPVCR